MKFSPSLIKNWMRCSLQAKFRYIDDIPEKPSAAAYFGTAVHGSLELLNGGASEEEVKEYFKKNWEEYSQEPDLTFPYRTSIEGYRDKGLEMLDKFLESRDWSADSVLAMEKRFCVPIGRHELSGIIDVLYVDDGKYKLKVGDYKTGYRPNKNNLHLDIQFTSYMYAVSRKEFWVGVPGSDKYTGFENGEELYEQYKDYEKVGVWFDLRNAKEYPVGPRGQTDIVRLYRCLDEIEKAMEKQVFVPNISGDTCKFCSYQDICPVYLSEEEIGKELA